MTITIYTIANDPFCTSEKEYLTAKALQFEEKNLETKREFLAEMMAASDNFAGVPFTIITKDDGSTMKLRGFTKEEFDAALSVPAVSPVVPAADMPATVTPVPVPVPTPTVSVSVSSPVEPARPAAPQKELEGVLNTLSSMSAPVAPTTPIQPAATPTSPSMPPAGSTSTDMPSIPDFTQAAPTSS